MGPWSTARCASAAASPPPALCPADGDPDGIDAEVRGAVDQPSQGGVRVVERGRERVFRREPIIDADDQQVEPIEDACQKHHILLGHAAHETAAVQPE